MSRIIEVILALFVSVIMSACGVSDTAEIQTITENQTATQTENTSAKKENKSETTAETEKKETISETEKQEENIMYIKIGDTVLTADLADNSSAEALKEMLAEGDVTIDMHDYGNFEKVGELGRTLPRNDEQITTQAGDIILYQGSNITIYYDKNSWNFTRLGRIKDVSQKELEDFLGAGDVTVTLSLSK